MDPLMSNMAIFKGDFIGFHGIIMGYTMVYPLVMTRIAMEKRPFIVDFSMKSGDVH